MKFNKLLALSPVIGLLYSIGLAQTSGENISLNDLTAFRDPGKNWMIAADATADYTKAGDLKPLTGMGAVVNNYTKDDNTHLVTKVELGDTDLELDFMMAKSSNSGVYLQGRYEVQLFDSWKNKSPTYSDAGGIYQRWDDARQADKGYEGIEPITSAARAPGLWQHLRIIFRAPKFDEQGKKISNARFEEVYLNGVLVQQQAQVTGPTRSSLYNDEKPLGPVMFQGDHGNVAFRNIRYHLPADSLRKQITTWENPIYVNPQGKPYLLRSFLMYGNKKLTHVISVGYPQQVNYSYDMKQGALLQIWRGQFLDVTDMWYERGEPQIAKPLGSLIAFSDAPAVATLADANAAWPDSLAFDDLRNKGYILDKDRSPTFQYELKGLKVTDKISLLVEGDGITRVLSVTDAPPGTYLRLAAAADVHDNGNGLYTIDKNYYIRLDKNAKPLIRPVAQGKEILLPVASASLTYSIIW